MTLFDYVLLVILALSVALSIWRGAVRELLALAAWVIAFLVAQAYAATVAAYLPASIADPSLRMLAGFVAVFLAVLILAAAAALAVSKLVRAVGLGLADRALGAIFGFVRGMLIALTAVLLAGLTPAPRDPLWRDAMFSPPLEALALAAKPWLPDELSKRIRYD